MQNIVVHCTGNSLNIFSTFLESTPTVSAPQKPYARVRDDDESHEAKFTPMPRGYKELYLSSSRDANKLFRGHTKSTKSRQNLTELCSGAVDTPVRIKISQGEIPCCKP